MASANVGIAKRPFVLVVDDESLVRLATRDTFESFGCKVYDASDGITALSVLAEHPQIDLIFSDIRMPGRLDGLGLAHAVREMHPEVRVVLTSAHHSMETGSFEFIQKPWDKRRLAALLDGSE